MKPADITIVGNGIIGLTAAMILAKNNFSIHLLGPFTTSTHNIPHNQPSRAFAIALGVQRYLARLSAWPTHANVGLMREVEVFCHQKASLHFSARDILQPTLAFIIDEKLWQDHLWQCVKANAQITLIDDQLKNYFIQDNKIVIETENHKSWLSTLLMGADGKHSKTRTLANISVQQENYHQQAIIAELKTTVSHHNTARQYFHDQDIVAFLPMNDPHHVALVWSTAEAEKYLALDERCFAEKLSSLVENTLGKLTLCSHRAHYPLQRQFVEKPIAERVLLIGDAAQVVHPLAGQGINIGVGDIAACNTVLNKTKNDIGSPLVLQRYLRTRSADRRLRTQSVHALKNYFASNSCFMPFIREKSLDLFPNIPGLALFCTKQAALLDLD